MRGQQGRPTSPARSNPNLSHQQFEPPSGGAFFDQEGAPWKSGSEGEPAWHQPHHELVHDALWDWKGNPSAMHLHAREAAAGAPQPSSGSGKMMRARAAALLHEIHTQGAPNPRMLYRGGEESSPQGMRGWSERVAVARRFARPGKGPAEVRNLPRGQGRGIRVADYIHSGLDDDEREWIIHHG